MWMEKSWWSFALCLLSSFEGFLLCGLVCLTQLISITLYHHVYHDHPLKNQQSSAIKSLWRNIINSVVHDVFSVKPCRDMELTGLNTSKKKDDTGGMWHIAVAPRAVLNYGKELETQSQQDQPSSLPRAHFLHPGNFHTATESSAFSPYTHDHNFKDRGLPDQCPRHSGKYRCIAQSARPHPLAQPGFYSPKIPRSKHSQPSVSSAKTLKVPSPTENIQEFYTHTLPLPHSKIAVLKQSRLFCKPQGIELSVVEKPSLMKALISETTESNQQQYSSHFECMKNQDIQNKCILHQSSLNLISTPISRRMEYVHNHCCPPQSDKLQPTEIQNIQSSSSVQKCEQDLDDISNIYSLPKSQSSLDQLNRHIKCSSNYCCSLCSGNCFQKPQDSSDYLESSQSYGNITQDQGNIHHSKDSTDVRNNSASNSSNESQVDVNSMNVFGQPRVIASLKASCSPQPIRKSTIVEDLKKLIVMDDTIETTQSDLTSLQQTKTTGRPSLLQHDSASPSPLMIANHVLSKKKLCRPSNLPLQPIVCQSSSGLSDSELCDIDLQFDHGLQTQPLPNTAAEVYEMQSDANILSFEPHHMCSGIRTVPCSPAYSCQNFPEASLPVSGEIDKDNFVEFPDSLSCLEITLRRLSSDLVKEKKNKVALLAEVLKLRMRNQYLKGESMCANAQLHKIYQTFNTCPGCME